MSEWTLLLAAWLLGFLLHGTLWLGGAWWIARRTRSAVRRDRLWKVACIGALLTPSAQIALQERGWIEPLGGVVALTSGARDTAPTPASHAGLALPPVAARSDADRSRLLEALLAASERAHATEEAAARAGTFDADALAAARARLEVAGGRAAASPSPPASTAVAGLADPRWHRLVSAVFLAGALLGASRLLVQLTRTRRRLAARTPLRGGALEVLLDELRTRAGLRRRVRLTLSPSLRVPVAFGWARAEICLPPRALRDLDRAQQRSMLGHELTHLRRGDPLWQLLFLVLERVFFFQPLLRVARRHAAEAAEELCDEWAAREAGGAENMATTLATVAAWLLPERRAPAALLPAMARHGAQLESRVERLLAPPGGDARRGGALAGAVLGLALALPALTPVFTPASAPPPAEPSQPIGRVERRGSAEDEPEALHQNELRAVQLELWGEVLVQLELTERSFADLEALLARVGDDPALAAAVAPIRERVLRLRQLGREIELLLFPAAASAPDTVRDPDDSEPTSSR